MAKKWQNCSIAVQGPDCVPSLCRISERIEQDTETFYKADPDPFDDRHPGNIAFTLNMKAFEPDAATISNSQFCHFMFLIDCSDCCISSAGRADPGCMLGQLLKMVFSNDDFANAVRTY